MQDEMDLAEQVTNIILNSTGNTSEKINIDITEEWPVNLYNAVFGESEFEIPEDVEETIEKVLSTLKDSEKLVTYAAFRDHKKAKDIPEIAAKGRCMWGYYKRTLENVIHKLRHPSRHKYLRLGISGYKSEEKKKDEQEASSFEEFKCEFIESREHTGMSEEEINGQLERLKLCFNQAIDDSMFTLETHNLLRRNGFTYLRNLCMFTEKDLLHIRNLGSSSLKEIITRLNIYGLSLKPVCIDNESTNIF